MAGEDDVIPREYRDGDELRRVHWKSTARYGELMVRREEQRWRNRATVLLDGRASSHLGAGAGSSFETAISAAASIGVHVAQEGLTGQFISDTDVVRSGPFFEDRLLDALAVIRPSNQRSLDRAFKELKLSGAGVIIAVVGKLTPAEAQQLAACRSEGSQGIALLLDVATWADGTRRADVTVRLARTGPTRGRRHRAERQRRIRRRRVSATARITAPDQQRRSEGTAQPPDTALSDGTASVRQCWRHRGRHLVGRQPAGQHPARQHAARQHDSTGPVEPDRPDTVVLRQTALPGPRARPRRGRCPPGTAPSRQQPRRSCAAPGGMLQPVDASTPIAVAWQRLPRAAEMLVATGTSIHPHGRNGQQA